MGNGNTVLDNNIPDFYGDGDIKNYFGILSFDDINNFNGTIEGFNLMLTEKMKSAEYIGDVPKLQNMLESLTLVANILIIALYVVAMTLIINNQTGKTSLYSILNRDKSRKN